MNAECNEKEPCAGPQQLSKTREPQAGTRQKVQGISYGETLAPKGRVKARPAACGGVAWGVHVIIGGMNLRLIDTLRT